MPTVLAELAARLEQSGLAAAVNSSRYVLGFLSGAHLVGFALVVGAAIVSVRYLPGSAEFDHRGFARTLVRVIGVGLTISVGSGFLLVAPRATSALENWIFALKMSLLIAAVVVHGLLLIAPIPEGRLSTLRRGGRVIATLLWVAVGVAGCAFILLE